ncbi:ABC transporter ATP-binding protein [Caldanaerobacter sp.]|uniref:ABC transporter ATP-binding protein n=1 Tax=Caldanaerobacter sp. TaxID=2930036 RepID=UPI00258D11F6|nr:ABC transporter ATP-binding protein [Caldanaerobacter sp.]
MLLLENVSVKYGAIEAIRGINMEIKVGSVVCLIGANGAGKSTTVNTIAGLVRNQGGKIFYCGEDISRWETYKRIEAGIAISMEGRRIFPDQTVYDNLLLGGYTRRKKMRELRRDIDQIMDKLPILKEKANQLAGTLSGGQQQILAIARALIAKPKLLLLDEPSLGLAPILIKEVYKIIKDLHSEGMTILLVEQFAQYAFSISDYVYVLEHGKIVLEGKPEDIKDDPRLTSAYLGE